MEIKILKLLSFKMTTLSLKDSMKKYKLKNDTMIESELPRLYKNDI